MQSPIRGQIKAGDPWHSRPGDKYSADLFIPGSWSGQRIVLTPAEGETWSEARIGSQNLEPADGDAWEAGTASEPGQWNTVSVKGGTIDGASLSASSHLRFASLHASTASERSLSVRIRLAGEASEREPGLLTIVITLSALDGRQAGGVEVTIGRRTRDLTVDMPVTEPPAGPYRLKASLCAEERVLDNARTDLSL